MKKILAVDDDASILELINDYLSTHNYQIVTCTEGGKVADLAIREEPDLIILDINLPDVDGLTVLKNLKTRPITAFIPVIMLTGQASAKSQVNGLISGADDYVTKPFDLNILYARVLNSLRRSFLPTRLKHEQFNLLSNLIRTYSKRGYKTFSKLLDNYEHHPDNWQGYVPDMIIKKCEKLRCFNFETTQSILEENFLDRLNSLTECRINAPAHFEAIIVTRTKDNYKVVRQLINENDLSINVKLIKKNPARRNQA